MTYRTILVTAGILLIGLFHSASAQIVNDSCFTVLYQEAKEWERGGKFIEAISHYDAARACPDATKHQDSLARQAANYAREAWARVLEGKIIELDAALEEARENKRLADVKTREAKLNECEALRAQLQALRSASISEAGRLALESDEETDLLIRERSRDRTRMEGTLAASYWAMRWAGDTLISEVTRSFGNAIFLNFHEYFRTKAGALEVHIDPQSGWRYFREFDGDVHVYDGDIWQYDLAQSRYAKDILFDSGRPLVVSVGTEFVKTWTKDGRESGDTELPESDAITVTAQWNNSGLFATGGRNGTLYLWDNSLQMQPLEGHSGHVTHLEFSSDGGMLLSTASDSTLRLWSRTGKALGSTGPLKGHIMYAGFNLNDEVLAVVDSTIYSWDISNGSFVTKYSRDHTTLITSAVMSFDGNMITGDLEGNVMKWTEDQVYRGDRAHQSYVEGMASLGFDRFLSWTKNGEVVIWDFRMKSLYDRRGLHQGTLRDIIVSPTGHYFITIGNDRRIGLRDRDGVEWMSPPPFEDDVWAAGFGPKEQFLWATSRENGVEVAWTCLVPQWKYYEMYSQDIKPTKEQVEAYKINTEVPPKFEGDPCDLDAIE